jgi:hypothetical protein
MPVKLGKDKEGNFARWGGGKKYQFTTAAGKTAAKNKASKQGQAAYSHGFKEKKK